MEVLKIILMILVGYSGINHFADMFRDKRVVHHMINFLIHYVLILYLFYK